MIYKTCTESLNLDSGQVLILYSTLCLWVRKPEKPNSLGCLAWGQAVLVSFAGTKPWTGATKPAKGVHRSGLRGRELYLYYLLLYKKLQNV